MIERLMNHYPTAFAMGGAALCGVAAIDMAQRAIRDLGEDDPEEKRINLSADLGGVLFYGLCAANIIPYTAVLGAVVFSGYSLYAVCEKLPFAYKTSEIWGNFLRTAINYTIVPLGNHVIIPLLSWFTEHIVCPLAEKIKGVASAIFNVISLPEHPVWYAVAGLVAAAVAYHVFPGVIPNLS
jgi:hypothetical protein